MATSAPPTHVLIETTVVRWLLLVHVRAYRVYADALACSRGVQGTFTVELYYEHAPKSCWNFAELARRGYYNNTLFHRIIQVRNAAAAVRRTLSCWCKHTHDVTERVYVCFGACNARRTL